MKSKSKSKRENQGRFRDWKDEGHLYVLVRWPNKQCMVAPAVPIGRH